MAELLKPSREIYIAGKVDASEVSIADLALELENRGHRIPEKWWTKGRLPKPYLDHLDTSTPAADAMIDAAYRSDVFILFLQMTSWVLSASLAQLSQAQKLKQTSKFS